MQKDTAMRTDQFRELETPVLLQWYANANRTCSCGGHYKGAMNEQFRLQYALELRERGVYVPKDIHEILDKAFKTNVDIPEGIFNGNGSF